MPSKSYFPDLDIPSVDLWSMYMEQPREYPDDHVLLIESETKRSYTFADMRDLSIALGQGLKHQFNWAKGDVLGFYAPNNIDTPVVNFGLHWAGGVASPANPTYTVDELAHQLQDSGAKALITTKSFLPAAWRAAQMVGIPRERVLLLGQEGDDTGKFVHWRDITAKGAWVKPKKTPIDAKKDLAYLVYSSGTTGLPKGVILTHYNLVANSYQSRRYDARGLTHDGDAQLGLLPFFHIYGLSACLNVTWLTGAPCVTMAKFDLEAFCRIIQDYRVTFMYVPPPIVLALSKHPIVDKYDLTSLRWINSAAAPVSMELVDAVWKRLKVGVKQGYGLSETSPTISVQLADEWFKFQGSVGKLYQNMVAKIVDPEGKELPAGEAGELLVKGPNVFSGYWNKPELNKTTFTEDGYFRTGDVGFICPKGNIYITDRIKELIKYKGFQVAPAELEAKIIGREDVADVCVVGVFNEAEHTEVPRAYVVLKPGIEASEQRAEDIAQWLSARVGAPKRLRGGVRFVKEIPKSQAGKILRRVLKDQIKKEEEGPKAKL